MYLPIEYLEPMDILCLYQNFLHLHRNLNRHHNFFGFSLLMYVQVTRKSLSWNTNLGLIFQNDVSIVKLYQQINVDRLRRTRKLENYPMTTFYKMGS